MLCPPNVKSQLTGKDPDAGKDWGQKEKGAAEDEMVDNITDSMNMNLSIFWEIVKDRGAGCAAVHGVAKSQTWQWLKNNNYTSYNPINGLSYFILFSCMVLGDTSRVDGIYFSQLTLS